MTESGVGKPDNPGAITHPPFLYAGALVVGAGLDRLIPRLVQLHRTLLANSQIAELLLAQELAEIARFAAKR